MPKSLATSKAIRHGFRWMLRGALVGVLLLTILAGWQWLSSERHSIQSSSLDQTRYYRVFNSRSDGSVVYSLDGQSLRNGLVPAVIFSVAAIVRGDHSPKIVAIESNSERDRNFRRSESTPTHWRPTIAGRSDEFDHFLLDELMPEIEQGSPKQRRRYLMGHSLSALYALDLGTRLPGRFSGILAFAPTFSHDTSISDRLPLACQRDTLLYANWGLESARDTEVFERAVTRWNADERCQGRTLVTSIHYGSLHQTIMLTGQLDVAFKLLE